MTRKRKSRLGFASIVFLLYIFPANLTFGQGFGGFGMQQGMGFGGANAGGSVGSGMTSPNYGPLTFRYPIENIIASQFPGEFVVNSIFGIPRQVGVSRKSSRGKKK